jgi:hypothetical protein
MVLWGVLAICFQQRCRPQSWEQFCCWILQALPGGEKFWMLGLAATCWPIWKSRNRTCFDKKPISSRGEILHSTCFFTKYWAGLYSKDKQLLINSGVEKLIKATAKIFRRSRHRRQDLDGGRGDGAGHDPAIWWGWQSGVEVDDEQAEGADKDDAAKGIQ